MDWIIFWRFFWSFWLIALSAWSVGLGIASQGDPNYLGGSIVCAILAIIPLIGLFSVLPDSYSPAVFCWNCWNSLGMCCNSLRRGPRYGNTSVPTDASFHDSTKLLGSLDRVHGVVRAAAV